MKKNGVGNRRLAEVFSAARHLCKTYGNYGINPTNDGFGVKRGTIANSNSKAVAPEFVQGAIDKLENKIKYQYGPRAAAQIRLQYELDLPPENWSSLNVRCMDH